MNYQKLNCASLALFVGLAASAAQADWTNNFTATEPFPPSFALRGIGTDTDAASQDAMRFVSQPNGLVMMGVLGSTPSVNPGASTVLALASTAQGAPEPDYTVGAVVNPDLATQVARIGVLARWDDINRNGIACVLDYTSGDLRIGRYDDLGRSFTQLAATPVTGFAANKSYRVVALAVGTNIFASAIDIAAGDTTVAEATAAVGSNLNGPSGVFVRSDSVTTPVNGTFARAFLEPLSRSRDVTGNGTTDVMWTNTSNNQLWSWDYGSAGELLGATPQGLVPAGYEVRGTGDFNEDGLADLVYNNRTTGESGIWLASSTGFVNISTQTLDPAAWEIVGVGEMTEDGIPDIIWRDRTNDVLWMWQMDRGRVQRAFPFFAVPSGWSMQAVGDFNLDGDEDLVFRNVDGRNGVLGMSDAAPARWTDLPSVTGEWRVFASADVNSDSNTDLFWRNEANGEQGLWLMNGASIASYTPIATLASPWRPAN